MKIENAKTRNSSSIFGEKAICSRTSVMSNNHRTEISYINVDQLVPYHKQSRRVFNQEEINNLAATIKEHGIRQPLTVLRVDLNNPYFEVVSGERRLRAAKLLEIKNVPCIIIDDSEKAEEIALVENIQRQDLHPIELGDGLASLLSRAAWGGVSKLAERIGKSHSTISNYLSYSKLPQDIKNYLIEHNIKSREVLRRLVKSTTLDEMNNVLGINTSRKKFETKSLLRINISENEFNIQDSSIYNLDRPRLLEAKNHLLNILKKIDERLC